MVLQNNIQGYVVKCMNIDLRIYVGAINEGLTGVYSDIAFHEQVQSNTVCNIIICVMFGGFQSLFSSVWSTFYIPLTKQGNTIVRASGILVLLLHILVTRTSNGILFM